MGTPCLACSSFYTFYLSYNVQRILYKSRSVYCNVYLYSTSSVVYCWVLCIHAVVERVYAVEVQISTHVVYSGVCWWRDAPGSTRLTLSYPPTVRVATT